MAGMAFELAKSSLKEIQIYSGDLLMHEFLLLTWLLCTKAVGSVKAKHSKNVTRKNLLQTKNLGLLYAQENSQCGFPRFKS